MKLNSNLPEALKSKYEELKDMYFTNYIFDIPCVYEGFNFRLDGECLIATGFDPSVIVNGKVTIPDVFDSANFIDEKSGVNLLNNKNIKEVDFGRIMLLESNVCKGCSALESVTGKQVLQIGKEAFSNCVTLRNIDFPEVVSVDDGAFSHCINLLKVVFGAAKVIGSYAFSDCENLVEVDLHGVRFVNSNFGQKDAPTGVFNNCEKLSKVDISGAFAIGKDMFKKCVFLKELYIPLVRVIYEGGLYQCSELETLYIDNLLGFKEKSLMGCVNLKNINYYGNQERWSQVMIESECELNILKNTNITLNYKDPEK